jgi:phage-related baseplate assembly protein
MTEPSTFTAVDLLRLPAPTIGETLNLDTLYGQLQTLLPTADGPAESESVVKLLKFAAYRKMLLPARVNAAARAVMPVYVTGADLDNLAALMSAKRLLITPGNMQANAPPVCAGDADLRRCQLRAFEGYSGTRPEGAYIFQALSAAFDLLDTSANSPTAGEVRITVLSRVRESTGADTAQHGARLCHS